MQVPRGDPTTKHRAVVLLSVLDQTRVLLGIEKLVRRHASIAPGIRRSATLEFEKLADHFICARLAQAKAGGIAICLGVFTEVLKTPVAIPRPLGCRWVNLIEIAQDRADRGMQTVKIKTIKPDRRGIRRTPVVVVS